MKKIVKYILLSILSISVAYSDEYEVKFTSDGIIKHKIYQVQNDTKTLVSNFEVIRTLEGDIEEKHQAHTYKIGVITEDYFPKVLSQLSREQYVLLLIRTGIDTKLVILFEKMPEKLKIIDYKDLTSNLGDIDPKLITIIEGKEMKLPDGTFSISENNNSAKIDYIVSKKDKKINPVNLSDASDLNEERMKILMGMAGTPSLRYKYKVIDSVLSSAEEDARDNELRASSRSWFGWP